MNARTVLLGLLLACGASVFSWYAVYQVDDAFIVYRYAENLAAGHGFVFNLGERVEGVTCFLWTLALAPFVWAGLPRVAPLLTALCGLGVLGLLPGLAARLEERARWDAGDLLAPALLLCHPAFAYWSVGALETVPYTLLVLLALRLHLDERGGGGLASAAPMAAALLMRPEAPLLALALALDRVLSRTRRTGRWLAAVGLPFAGFLVFRRAYFGAWLPNTYYAKTGGPWLDQVHRGVAYTGEFLSALLHPVPAQADNEAWAWMAGGALLAALLVWGLRRPALRAPALIVLATSAAVLLEGGDWMVLHRFFVPALPPIAALAAVASRRALRRSPRLGVAAHAALLGLAVLWITYGIAQRSGPRGLVVNAEGYRYAHRQVAAWLRAHARPGDRVALMDVGIIGYESGLPIIDISGLVDPRIARAPGGFLNKQYPVAALLARHPRYVVLVDQFVIDRRIALDLAFLRSHRLVLARNHRFNWVPPDSYTLHVFERVDP